MFEILRAGVKIARSLKTGQTVTVTKSRNITEAGRMLDVIQDAEREDALVGTTVKDPMAQHDWFNIAISWLGRNIARTEFKLMNGDTEITDGDIFDLFNHPNPYMSKYQLWEATESWLASRGESIWVFPALTGAQLPDQIWVSNPTQWKHYLNEDKNRIILWKFFAEGDAQGVPFNPEEILHLKYWNIWDFWRGVPPWRALTQDIEQDYQANVSNTFMIKNRSVPAGIISSEQIINDESAKELIKRWEEKHKGAIKAGKISVLGKGAKYQPIGLTPDEMQFMQMFKWNRDTILAMFGLSIKVFGINSDNSALSGSDTKEVLKAAWNLKLIPEMRSIVEKLKVDFFKRFGLNEEGKFDTSEIPELQVDKAKQEERLREDIKTGLITINEARDKLEMEPVDWGNGYFKPFNLEYIESAEEEEEPEAVPGFPPVEPEGPPEPLPGVPVPTPPGRSLKADRWLISYLIESGKLWDKLTGRYTSKIDKWFYKARSYYLEKYTKSIDRSITKTYEEFLFWHEAAEELKAFSVPFFDQAINQINNDLVTIYTRVGLRAEFNIYETDIPIADIIRTRIDKLSGIADTMNKSMAELIERNAIEGFDKDLLAQQIRDRFKDIEGKSKTIAETELGALKSKVQSDAYLHEGVEKIRWIHVPNPDPRDWHIAQDGMVRDYLVEPFPNGLFYPRQEGAPAEEVINCHCEFVPVMPGEE